VRRGVRETWEIRLRKRRGNCVLNERTVWMIHDGIGDHVSWEMLKNERQGTGVD